MAAILCPNSTRQFLVARLVQHGKICDGSPAHVHEHGQFLEELKLFYKENSVLNYLFSHIHPLEVCEDCLKQLHDLAICHYQQTNGTSPTASSFLYKCAGLNLTRYLRRVWREQKVDIDFRTKDS